MKNAKLINRGRLPYSAFISNLTWVTTESRYRCILHDETSPVFLLGCPSFIAPIHLVGIFSSLCHLHADCSGVRRVEWAVRTERKSYLVCISHVSSEFHGLLIWLGYQQTNDNDILVRRSSQTLLRTDTAARQHDSTDERRREGLDGYNIEVFSFFFSFSFFPFFLSLFLTRNNAWSNVNVASTRVPTNKK